MSVLTWVALCTCLVPAVENVAVTPSDFYRKRARILRQESQSFLGSDLTLNMAEYFANAYLMKIKKEELDLYFKGSKTFPLSTNFLDSKSDIESSMVFKFLQGLPKGGALHLHEYSMVSTQWIVANLTYRPDLFWCTRHGPQLLLSPRSNQYARRQTGDEDEWLDFGWFSTQENNITWQNCTWERIVDARERLGKGVVDDKILRTIQFMSDSFVGGNLEWAWSRFERMITAVSRITNLASVFQDFMYQAYQEFLSDKVQYVEFRTILQPVCKVSLDEGCHAMDPLEVATLQRNVVARFTSENEGFCGAKMIYSPYRGSSKPQIQDALDLQKKLMAALPGFVIGFDLVGQEDLGKPLIDFADLLLGQNKIPYYFHAGETNWQGEETDINLVDAVLLGAKRIGHGYAIVKHPKLKLLAKEKNIPLEICPISNQMLDLAADLRNHPAAILIQENHPLVVSSDDPSPFGAKGLSYDFYAAFMGMSSKNNMDLRLLKRLVLNSMDHSEAGSACKVAVLRSWKVFIHKFVPQLRQIRQEEF